MDMRKLVGRNFGRTRKEKGFTQERFAEASGFTQQYISDLERGRRNPTVVTLFELAGTLGMNQNPKMTNVRNVTSRKPGCRPGEPRIRVRRRSGSRIGGKSQSYPFRKEAIQLARPYNRFALPSRSRRAF